MLPDKCPSCNASISDRNVEKKVKEVFLCRKCNAEVMEQYTTSFSDADALALSDLSVIDRWLSAVREEKIEIKEIRRDPILGYLWTIPNLPRWTCEIRFAASQPGRLDIVLIGERSVPEGEETMKVVARLEEICAPHGLQAQLSQIKTLERLGVQQSLAVHTVMSGKNMKPILSRLQAAMDDVSKEYDIK